MNLENIKAKLDECHNLATSIGMEVLSTDDDTCCAVMTVDERNCQPFGYLSGGASLAMAETLAGCGSCALCPDAKACVGQDVHASHVHPARIGERVTATARIVHQGHKLHIWHIDITNDEGSLISTISVTNCIIW